MSDGGVYGERILGKMMMSYQGDAKFEFTFRDSPDRLWASPQDAMMFEQVVELRRVADALEKIALELGAINAKP